MNEGKELALASSASLRDGELKTATVEALLSIAYSLAAIAENLQDTECGQALPPFIMLHQSDES